MNDNPDKLIKFEIKGRKVTYYLVTEEDLNNIKSKSTLGDIFTVLASLSVGGIIAIITTKATAVELNTETISLLNLLNYVFVASSIIFGCFVAFFYYQSFSAIKKIKRSGIVKSFKSVERETEIEQEKINNKSKQKLEIIEAFYGTQKAEKNISEELNNLVVNNKLKTVASNKIAGDPDYGTVKKLKIKYRFSGIIVTKEYTEGDKVEIP